MGRTSKLIVPGIIGLLPCLAIAQDYQAQLLYPINAPSGYTNFTATVGIDGNAFGSASPPTNPTVTHAIACTPNGTVDRNPAGAVSSQGLGGGGGGVEVGSADFSAGVSSAIEWRGPSSPYQILSTSSLPGIVSSAAFAEAGGQIVGQGDYSNADFDAILWSFPNAIDLKPTNIPGITNTQALGVSDVREAGIGYGLSPKGDALVWSGSGASAIDLNPTFLSDVAGSAAYSTGGAQEAGVVYFGSGANSYNHAFLWNNSAASAIDLNPSGLTDSTALAVHGEGGTVVGFGEGSQTNGETHAFAWNGTAASAIDLSQFLPVDATWDYSVANAIDLGGMIFGEAQEISEVGGIPTPTMYAVEWSPVPEPASASLILIGAPMLLRRRKRF